MHATPRYTKLLADGTELPSDATNHEILRVEDGSIAFEIRLAHVGERRLTHAEATEAVAALGDGWRLPTDRELAHLVDRSRFNPACDPALLPGTKAAGYWASSPDASDPSDYAWVVDFYRGDVDLDYRGYNAWVRAVRSAAPARQSSAI